MSPKYRTVAYGYRLGEVPLPELPEVKSDLKLKTSLDVNALKRPVVAVSSGVHVSVAAQPHPCPNHKPTIVAGVMKRMGSKPPDSDGKLLLELKQFVSKWCEENLTPIQPSADTSIDAWLEKCIYPKWRKDYLATLEEPLRVKLNSVRGWIDISKVKAFTKMETYPEFKHARGIYSRSDYFKIKTGPIFKLIEKEVFKHDYFIKKIPIADRPAYIQQQVYQHGASVIATDYSSFESAFIKKLMNSCEMIMYEYMIQNLPEKEDFLKCMLKIKGTQDIKYKDITINVSATRMSGEMCTSLGNGFSNLMFTLFLAEKHGVKSLRGVVEGDDGLFSFYGNLKAEHYAQLGLTIKLENVEDINSASFCGLIFDEHDLANVTDPIEVIQNFGWLNPRYVSSADKRIKELLRCKSLSLAHQYPGCPIIQSLAHYGLRITRGITIRLDKIHMSNWEREQLLQAIADKTRILKREIGMNTRLLVERKFGINISEQISLEKYLDGLNGICELKHEVLEIHSKLHHKQYMNDYCFVTDVSSRNMSYPILPRRDLSVNNMSFFTEHKSESIRKSIMLR